ncbi:MAG: catecholate siderophore receptor Fiu [Pseudomonadota bacterium]
MSYIRNRKHAAARNPMLTPTLIALAAMSASFGAQARTAPEKKEVELQGVTVKAAADVPYKADKVTSPKLTQPLLDTTQTITVIKKEVLQEQGANSLVDALRNTPGITLQLGENGNTSAGDTFQMRGFSTQSSVFVDGIRDLGAVSRDVFNIEQIEVSRGPAGTDVGRGAASGYINLASKVPNQEAATSGTVSYDSGTKARATVDHNHPLSDTSAFRINAMVQDGGQMGRKVIDKRSQAIAPSLAFGLGTPTKVYLFSQHLRQDGVPDGGIPAIGIPGYFFASTVPGVADAVRRAPRVDLENFYGYASDYEDVKADMVTVKVEHQLGAKTTLTNTSRYGKSSMDRILTGVNALTATSTDRSTWTVARTRQSVLQDNRIMANSTNLVSEFDTGGIGHTVSAGLEFLSEEQFSATRVGLGALVNANLYNPVPTALTAFAPVRNGAYSKGETTTAAAYVFDTIKLNDKWQLNGGLRVEHYNTETNAATAKAVTTPQTIPVGTLIGSHVEKSDNLVSWKAGALYKPSVDGSIYLAYATSQTPPGSANFGLSATAGNIANPSMDAQKTTNLELGAKWDLIQKQLAVTATIYRTENKNEFPVLEDPVALTYSQGGNRRVQGVELGVVGQITRNWSVIGGIATMDAEIIEGAGTTLTGTGTRWSPDLSATLWSTYKLSDAFSVGGGVRYMGEQKRVIAPNQTAPSAGAQAIESYVVADAVASYKVSKNVTLQLNVYNLFDKFHVVSLNNGGSRINLGVERSAQLTANIGF